MCNDFKCLSLFPLIAPPLAKCVLPVDFSSLSTFPVSPFLDRLKTVVLTVIYVPPGYSSLADRLTVPVVPKKNRHLQIV